MSSDRVAWLPYADRAEAEQRLRGLPDGIVVEGVTDPDALPDSVADVGFYVLPYLTGARGLARATEMTSLEVVQTQTAGFDDVLAAIPPGVTLCNAAGLHDASTAEMALALMLSIGRHLDDAARNQPEGRWQPQWGSSIADQQILIVGYGRIGAAIERRLAGFEVGGVTRVARRARPNLPEDSRVQGIEDLDRLLPEADIVVLVAPLNPGTRRMFDERRLGLLHDDALLVNVGRGGLVDTDALVVETSAGRLRAAMDVTDPEPLPAEHPLWRCPGVLISPHVGGASSAFWPRADALIGAQLHRWAAGEPMANLVRGDTR